MESTNLDINIDYSNEPFYSEIWFWVLIALFFLVLLVLLIRGGRKSSRCTQSIENKNKSQQSIDVSVVRDVAE